MKALGGGDGNEQLRVVAAERTRKGTQARTAYSIIEDHRARNSAGHFGVLMEAIGPYALPDQVSSTEDDPLERAAIGPDYGAPLAPQYFKLAQDRSMAARTEDPEGTSSRRRIRDGTAIRHSGARQRREPDIHNHQRRRVARAGHHRNGCGYGLSGPRSIDRNDATQRCKKIRYFRRNRLLKRLARRSWLPAAVRLRGGARNDMTETKGWSRALWNKYVDLRPRRCHSPRSTAALAAARSRTMIVMKTFRRALALGLFRTPCDRRRQVPGSARATHSARTWLPRVSRRAIAVVLSALVERTR